MTEAEKKEKAKGKNPPGTINKSRYDGIDCYISTAPNLKVLHTCCLMLGSMALVYVLYVICVTYTALILECNECTQTR
jgi:hypothetical protein